MNIPKILSLGTIVMLLLGACSPTTTLPTSHPQVTAAVPTNIPPLNGYPLSGQGPYHIGLRSYTFTDPTRNNRQVKLSVFYPALSQASWRDASPDMGNAPYPLILSSSMYAAYHVKNVVSYGFVWVGIDNISPYLKMNDETINQPLDILFALNQVASGQLEELTGMIDSEHAGVTGYSFDGYNTLALSGARIDPEYYLSQCPNPDEKTQSIIGANSAFGCGPAGAWDEFAALAGPVITTSQDGLWQQMTDSRIRAVMPLAGEGWWLFGERGLAAVDRPTLMITGTQDGLYPENALIFEHLGTSDKAFISFIGPNHMDMINDSEMVSRMAHFTVAFFGYHLQGRDEYAKYFSEDFVAERDDLAWGPYTK